MLTHKSPSQRVSLLTTSCMPFQLPHILLCTYLNFISFIILSNKKYSRYIAFLNILRLFFYNITHTIFHLFYTTFLFSNYQASSYVMSFENSYKLNRKQQSKYLFLNLMIINASRQLQNQNTSFTFK